MRDWDQYRDLFIPLTCNTLGRRSGRTTWMMIQLIQAVKDGQPRCKVVAAADTHRQMLKRVFWEYAIKTFDEVQERQQNVFTIDGEQTVEFDVVRGGLPVTKTWVDEAFPGYNGGVFVDHYTDGEV